ncbi:MAG: ubiquinol-cytochrome c reductase iron-sulfur subunit [Candidatus Latescibacteria bacterium]|nr:ubiquinol-cytochrome c reductase iron-sulfur subunit [Candidatus Latescibacterota bacterium]
MSHPVLSRRSFLTQSGMALLGTGLALGCAAMTTLEVAPQNGRLVVDTAMFQELAEVGGAIHVKPSRLSDPLLLIRTGAEEYRAVSTICTHLGCQVRKTRLALRCPCHGSVYDFEGRVINGPAKQSLLAYAVDVAGTTVTIHLG